MRTIMITIDTDSDDVANESLRAAVDALPGDARPQRSVVIDEDVFEMLDRSRILLEETDGVLSGVASTLEHTLRDTHPGGPHPLVGRTYRVNGMRAIVMSVETVDGVPTASVMLSAKGPDDLRQVPVSDLGPPI